MELPSSFLLQLLTILAEINHPFVLMFELKKTLFFGKVVLLVVFQLVNNRNLGRVGSQLASFD